VRRDVVALAEQNARHCVVASTMYARLDVPMTQTRFVLSLALGVVLAAGVAACFVDPVPPNPHGDAGDDPPDPPDGGDGGEAGP
jgi:hypothetical protein